LGVWLALAEAAAGSALATTEGDSVVADGVLLQAARKDNIKQPNKIWPVGAKFNMGG
jgi:hypothetical protein